MSAAPIFILAAPFSGTAWLAARLGAHSHVLLLPELSLFMADRVSELMEVFALSQTDHAQGLLEAVALLAQTEAPEDWIEPRGAQRVGELLRELAELAAPRRLLIPDTESPLRPMDLRRLREQLPDVQLLHLTRHPWTQGLRLANWARERLFVPADFKDHLPTPPIVDPQIPWLRAQRNIDALIAALPPRQSRRMPIEACMSDANAALAEICAWLELPAGEIGSAHAHAQVIFDDADADEGSDVPTDPAQLDQPLPWRDDDIGFAVEVRELARRYGYL